MAAPSTGSPIPKPSKEVTAPKNVLSMLHSVVQQIQRFNSWLAQWSHIPVQWLPKFEVIGLVGGGATLIQLGEYALAVGCWLILAIIWVSKAFAWKGEWGRPRRNTFLKVSNVILALVTCIVLITWTNIKRQDDYWTALQKLWTHYRLNIFTVATNKEYAPGTVIGGIVWRPVYTELDLIVNNPTDGNYDDVNILVRPDYPVAKIAQLSNLSDVSFEDRMGVTARMTIEDLSATPTVAVPFDLIATTVGYRVHCGRIPPNSSLRLVMALVDIKKSNVFRPGYVPNNALLSDFALEQTYTPGGSYWYAMEGAYQFYAPRPTPSTVSIEGSYSTKDQPHTVKTKVPVK